MSLQALLPSTALVALAALMSGCNCSSDVQYTALTPPEPLDSDHGQWLSMDVAPDGRLVSSYYDRDRGAVGFAIGEIRDGGEVWWTHERVDGYADEQGLDPGDVGWHTSMKVADNGDVWLAYYAQQNGALKVAHREGGVWSVELADAGTGLNPDTGRWASLALDADNNPVVAHHDVENGTLRISRRSADGDWSSEVAYEGENGTDSEGGVIEAKAGSYARLLIHEGTEYIAFHDEVKGSLELLEGFPGAYTLTTVETGGVGQWPSMWTDGTTLLIAFHDMTNQDLKLSRRDGSSWETVTIDSDEYVGADTEVFRDTEGIGVVYFDGQFNDMRIAREDGTGWTTESIGGTEQAVGYHNEIAYTNGRWFAASYDYTNRTIFTHAL